MDTLEQARAEIDAVDAQLAALFERRMAAVLSVAQYKQAHGLPVYDAAREAVVLEKAAARIQDPALRPYYRDHVQNMMDVAKQYEAEVLGENRAAYQGVEGAFAHIALRALFPHAEAVSYPTWDEVIEAVKGVKGRRTVGLYHGECVALGMLPMIESKALQKRVRAVYRRLGLPLRTAYNKDKVYAEMLHDKKAQGGQITVIKVPGLGCWRAETIPVEGLRTLLGMED